MTARNLKFDCDCGVGAVFASDGCWECPKCHKEVMQIICRTGCNTQDHESYWECLQAANVSIDKSSLRP